MSDTALSLLADASLRVTVLAAIVAVIVIALRVRTSRARHTLWTMVLFAMLLMPVLPWWVPAIAIPFPAPSRGAVIRWVSATSDAPSISATTAPTPSTAAVRTGTAPASPMRTTVTPRSGGRWPFVAFITYAAFTLFLIVRLFVGWRAAARISRRSDPITLWHERDDLSPWADKARVCESTLVATPVTVGVVSPTILLPSAWRGWSKDQLRAVLAHEYAHVVRRDTLVSLVAQVNHCVFWFHPLAWWLERQIAITAEDICDDVGVRAVGEARCYADVLVDIAAAARKSGGRLVSQAVAIDGSRLLGRRIDRLLHGGVEPELSAAKKVAVAATCAATIFVVAACRPSGPMVDEKRNAERRRIAWLIEHYADTEVAVKQVDRPEAETVLLRKKAQDPTGPWSSRLGRFYASSLVGHWVRISERGPYEEITDADPKSAFAQAARRKLAESTDDALLIAAADFLLRSPRRLSSFDEFDLLAKSYLERAVNLRPESMQARAELVALLVRERVHWQSGSISASTRSVLRKTPPVSQYEIVSSLPAAERFELLLELALGAYRSAQGASRWDDRNLDDYIRLAFERSKRYALDLLALAPTFHNHPSYGTAVYRANMTLASLALRDGDTRAAVEYLRQAAAAPASEELMYSRGIASWGVINDLVNAGEREVVAGFLEQMAQINVVERSRLLDAADKARRGETPVL